MSRPVKPPKKRITMQEWQEVLRQTIPDIEKGAIACAATITQLHLDFVTNPAALALKDSPSSGKTVCLSLFKGITEICDLNDELTANALMSGSATNKNGEKDYLRQLKDKCLIVPDLATVFADNDDAVRSHLGKLTRILDGQGYAKADGANGKRTTQVEGDDSLMLTLLMGTTELSTRVWSLMSGLGPRMFFMELGSKRPDAQMLIEHMMGESTFTMKNKLAKEATENFIRTVFNTPAPSGKLKFADGFIHSTIANLAIFMSYMRSDIRITPDRFNKNEIAHTSPQREHAWRLAVGLVNYASAHAFMRGSDCICREDLVLLFWLAFGTGPSPRPQMAKEVATLGKIFTHKDIKMEPSQVKRELYSWSLLGMGELKTNRTVTPFVEDAYGKDEGLRQDFFDDNVEFTFILDDSLCWINSEEMKEFYATYNIL